MRTYKCKDWFALWKRMENRVKREVKHYKEDFYQYDREQLNRRDREDDTFRLVWMTRNSGTWMFAEDDTSFYEAVKANGMNEHEYRITKERNGEYTFTKLY